jgi:nitrogen-specific signal transduction histidine kinase
MVHLCPVFTALTVHGMLDRTRNGLRLEITRQFVRRHRGDISEESRPGHTEFCVSVIVKKGS